MGLLAVFPSHTLGVINPTTHKQTDLLIPHAPTVLDTHTLQLYSGPRSMLQVECMFTLALMR